MTLPKRKSQSRVSWNWGRVAALCAQLTVSPAEKGPTPTSVFNSRWGWGWVRGSVPGGPRACGCLLRADVDASSPVRGNSPAHAGAPRHPPRTRVPPRPRLAQTLPRALWVGPSRIDEDSRAGWGRPALWAAASPSMPRPPPPRIFCRRGPPAGAPSAPPWRTGARRGRVALAVLGAGVLGWWLPAPVPSQTETYTPDF